MILCAKYFVYFCASIFFEMAKRTFTYNIEAQDIDFRRKVSLTSLVNFLLITAGKNADENGFGVLDLQSGNYTWVLSRLAFQMERIPTDADVISIETWIEDVGTAFTTRNFKITDASGVVIGWASSSWAIIDLDTRRPVLLDTLPGLQRFIVADTTPVGIPARIPSVHGEVANTFKVKYSDTDVNVHANSLHYIRWVSDCFPLDFYRNHSIKQFEINFLKELTFADEGEVYRETKETNDFYFQLVTRDKGVCCRARLVFGE